MFCISERGTDSVGLRGGSSSCSVDSEVAASCSDGGAIDEVAPASFEIGSAMLNDFFGPRKVAFFGIQWRQDRQLFGATEYDSSQSGLDHTLTAIQVTFPPRSNLVHSQYYFTQILASLPSMACATVTAAASWSGRFPTKWHNNFKAQTECFPQLPCTYPAAYT